MFVVDILEREKENTENEEQLRELNKAIFILRDPDIITKGRLEQILEGLYSLIISEIKDEDTLRRLAEGIQKL